jgi:hypothetical protein
MVIAVTNVALGGKADMVGDRRKQAHRWMTVRPRVRKPYKARKKLAQATKLLELDIE